MVKNSAGFSLVEVLVVTALLGIILALGTTNLFRPLSQSKIDGVANDIISIVHEAQNKSMSTDTQNQASTSEYGVHFDTDKYTLFRGTAYSAADPSNFVNSVPTGITISADLRCNSAPTNCNSNVVFQKISGDVINYDLDVTHLSSICLTETSSQKKIKLVLNSVGVVDESETNC